jgi:hypothetical protein
VTTTPVAWGSRPDRGGGTGREGPGEFCEGLWALAKPKVKKKNRPRAKTCLGLTREVQGKDMDMVVGVKGAWR